MLSRKFPIPPHPALLLYPPTPTSWPWCSPVLGNIKFAIPRASLSSDGWLGHLLLHMQLETRVLGVLVSSYCCSTYRVEDHFSSLGTFSSSTIGGPVFHPIANCEHPLLCLQGIDMASQETAISAKSCWHMRWCLHLEADYGMDFYCYLGLLYHHLLKTLLSIAYLFRQTIS